MYGLLRDLQKEQHCFIPSRQDPRKAGCSTDSEPLLQQTYVFCLFLFPYAQDCTSYSPEYRSFSLDLKGSL